MIDKCPRDTVADLKKIPTGQIPDKFMNSMDNSNKLKSIYNNVHKHIKINKKHFTFIW